MAKLERNIKKMIADYFRTENPDSNGEYRDVFNWLKTENAQKLISGLKIVSEGLKNRPLARLAEDLRTDIGTEPTGPDSEIGKEYDDW